MRIGIFVVVMSLLFIVNEQAWSADSLFFDDFSSAATYATNWPESAETTGGATVNLINEKLFFRFPVSSDSQSALLNSKSFDGPSQWRKINLSGSWGSGNLDTIKMKLFVYDADSYDKELQKYTKYLEVVRTGSDITFYNSSTESIKTVPQAFADPAFSFRFSRVGWKYYEGATLAEQDLTNLADIDNIYTMNKSKTFFIALGGERLANSYQRGFWFDNIGVQGSVVPEPVSMFLFGVGGAVLGLCRKYKSGKNLKK